MTKKLQLDAIDIAIRKNVKEQPGCSVAAAIDPLRVELSDSPLRWRVGQMVRHGLLRAEKEKHITRLYPVGGQGDEL
jgi:hypothetical protein